MAIAKAKLASAAEVELNSSLAQLRDEATVLMLPGLYAAGLVTLLIADRYPSLALGVITGLSLCALGCAVWAIRRWSRPVAAWALVIGCLLAVWQAAAWGRLPAVVYLFTVPVGLAALTIGMAGCWLAAVVCTALLFSPLLRMQDTSLRMVALIGVWSTAGMVWLTLRPLMRTLEWSWAAYEQSRSLLEQARDSQVKLKQTLADLADANLQLTRLNRLAQGLRQAAEEARRAKEQFVANVSHELRTPLNMVIGYSEMILQTPNAYGEDLPPALLADLEVIHRNSQHLSSLIDDVLDLSQIEAGRVALTKEHVRLHEILEAAATAVRPLFTAKGLRLEMDIPPDLELYCDRTRIREVVLNLLSNAGRYTDRGGAFLRAWREGYEVVVSVADTGPGIAHEEKAKVFQPFQQLDASLHRRHGGSGLGLSISKHFVELHGGKMWFESQKGAGTTFYFRLPINPPLPPADDLTRWLSPEWHYRERARPSLAPTPSVRPRFVVLEAGNVLQRLLNRYFDGVELVPVSTLDEAIAELSRTPARALLVNDVAAGEALQRLNLSAALPYGTPAIVCSVPGTHEAAGTLGVSDYLVKPVARDALLAALDRLSLKGRTVLVADDEPEALRLFWRMLASSPRRYRVVAAGDGQRALQMLRELQPAVLLLDLVMPGMDGFQLLAAKRDDPEIRDIPVIVLSARDPAGQPIVASALAATRAGGLSVAQLLAAIRSLTGILATAGQAGDPAPQAALPG